MPHIQAPSPPPPSPPPPPNPFLMNPMRNEINATFGLSIAAVCFTGLMLLMLIGMSVMIYKLFSKVGSKSSLPKYSSTASSSATKAVAETPASSDMDVAVAVAPVPMAMHSTLAHVLAVVVSGVIAIAVGMVLVDGVSVIKLKPAWKQPEIMNPKLKEMGLTHPYRADELLGPSYGIGLFMDQSGATWTEVNAGKTLAELERDLGIPVIIGALPSAIATDDLKHPVPFLSCNSLQAAGLAAMSLGFVAMSVAVVMMIFHLLVLVGMVPSKIAKPVAALIWFVLSVGFCTVIALAVGIYTATWECRNNFITSIKLSEYFEYNYGFPFAIVGYIASLLILCVTLFITSGKDGTPEQPAGLKSPVTTLAFISGGVVTGSIIATAIALAIAGANGAFDAKPLPDPSINTCEGKKPRDLGPGDHYFKNQDCVKWGLIDVLEQAGANVTEGFRGDLYAADRMPISVPYSMTPLCPVNVHWHKGAEHLSVGQYDEHGSGPGHTSGHRQLAGATVDQGHYCHHYDANDTKFTTPYHWNFCQHMEVGETYEVHWPHSAAGACGTRWQYQYPFYDGVFCNDKVIEILPMNTYKTIGVQAQVFTVVNTGEAQHYAVDDLFSGMKVDPSRDMGTQMTYYTGSTTGQSRSNQICSRYTPITWQVDRKCHLIEAASFDQLCKKMLEQPDDMTGDTYPHGARETVSPELTASNQLHGDHSVFG